MQALTKLIDCTFSVHAQSVHMLQQEINLCAQLCIVSDLLHIWIDILTLIWILGLITLILQSCRWLMILRTISIGPPLHIRRIAGSYRRSNLRSMNQIRNSENQNEGF